MTIVNVDMLEEKKLDGTNQCTLWAQNIQKNPKRSNGITPPPPPKEDHAK